MPPAGCGGAATGPVWRRRNQGWAASVIPRISHCNKGLFSAKLAPIYASDLWFARAFAELGHTSAQLALLVDRAQSPSMRRIAGLLAVSATPFSESRHMPTIALVDDDRNILTSVSIALEAEGYRIMTYTDGASALDGFRTSPPDLAILDIKMSRMDGMETLRRLRQKSDLPVIFLTSKDEEIDELFGLKMGADDFIPKPFSQRLLVERVKAVLRRVSPKDGTVPK